MCPFRSTISVVYFDLYSRFGHDTGYAYYRSGNYRGAYHTQCSDYPADVKYLNQPQSWITRDRILGLESTEGWKDEGYVWVDPWYDPGNLRKICAFDAQLTEISSTGTDCSTYEANFDPECGCGENLKWCNREGGEGPFNKLFQMLYRLMFDQCCKTKLPIQIY